jgi:segregation and condensation protein A
MQKPYKVQLPDVFEGPMDLLFHLIKKNKVDIYDIPIAVITEQYLEYVNWMKTLKVDVAGDFILMAATLTQIKSKMLLPVHDDEDEEDPRLAIARPLQEYLEIKAAAEKLSQRDLLGVDTFTRQSSQTIRPAVSDDGGFIQVGIFELMDAFRRILDNVEESQKLTFATDPVSVKARMNQIINLLEEKGSVTFDELFDHPVKKKDVVVTLLAVLEIVKLELVQIIQHVQTGIIRLFYQ